MLAQLKAAAQQQPSILSGLASVLASAGQQQQQAQAQQPVANGPAPATHGHGFVAVSSGQAAAGAHPSHQAAVDAGMAALHAADAAREAALSKLRGLLDAGGGLASDQHAGLPSSNLFSAAAGVCGQTVYPVQGRVWATGRPVICAS
jgi:hypothetical protein